MMQIEKEYVGEKIIYHVKGRIDTQTSPKFQKFIEEGFDNAENKIIVDLKETVYISSAGLRVILYAQKRIDDIPNASLDLINVNPVVMEVFNITGFTDFIKIKN